MKNPRRDVTFLFFEQIGRKPNSNLRRSKMKSSISSTLRSTLVAATLVITLSPACWAREQNQTDVRPDETISVSPKSTALDLVEGGTMQRDAVLSAQAAAPWCYTSYGRYPMLVAMPPGAFCQVNVPFYPFILTGVT